MKQQNADVCELNAAVSDVLDLMSLEALIAGNILAMHIAKYCSVENAARFLGNESKTVNLERYTHETYENGTVKEQFYGVYRWGTPFNSTYGKPADGPEKQKYYGDAATYRSRIENMFKPDPCAIDILRSDLNRIWRHGAELAHFEGKQMFSGIVRAMFSESAFLSEEAPHVDSLPIGIAQLSQQLGANIYLKTPEQGGELLIFDLSPFSQEQVETFENGKLPISEFQDPVKIKPAAGDLIIVNTRRPHAIRGFQSDEGRMSIQTFIGFNPGEPLQFWC